MSEQPVGPPGLLAISQPTRVGDYTVLTRLGAGGMATVYLARAEGPGGFRREVALKLVHAHVDDADTADAELLAEARLAAKIRNRNVVQVLDVNDSPAGLFLVMEYIEGGSLQALQRQYRKAHREASAAEGTHSDESAAIPLSIALGVLSEALSGLHAAHELCDESGRPLGLVHRDFSPQNILVGVDGSVKLADFGIAKLTRAFAQTRSGALKGKASYMAPEQIRGRRLDRRCDVWAAGIVAWELLTGRRLRPRVTDEMATLMKTLSEEVPPVSSVRSDIPPDLERVVAQALERDPARRFASASDFREALLQAAERSSVRPARVDDIAEFATACFEETLLTRKRLIRGPEAEAAAPEDASQDRQTLTDFSSGAVEPKDARRGHLVLGAALALLLAGTLVGRWSASRVSSGSPLPGELVVESQGAEQSPADEALGDGASADTEASHREQILPSDAPATLDAASERTGTREAPEGLRAPPQAAAVPTTQGRRAVRRARRRTGPSPLTPLADNPYREAGERSP